MEIIFAIVFFAAGWLWRDGQAKAERAGQQMQRSQRNQYKDRIAAYEKENGCKVLFGVPYQLLMEDQHAEQ